MFIDCISEYKKVLDGRKLSNASVLLDEFDDKFKITKQRDGIYPAIITISGFCTEDLDNRIRWQTYVLNKYPDREWFHVEWNAEKWPFGKKEMTKFPIEPEENRRQKKSPILVTALLSMIPYGRTVLAAKAIVNNFWHRAVRNSRIAGRMLAMVLDACPRKNFILLGHSLGARIIYNCLEELNDLNSEKKILEAHLFGGAVGNSPEKWLKVSEKVMGEIHNYHSKHDMVLRLAYSISMISFRPIGLTQISCTGVVNNDWSYKVFGHCEYFPVLRRAHRLSKKEALEKAKKAEREAQHKRFKQ